MRDFLKNLTKEAGRLALNFFQKEKNLISLRGQSKEVVTKYDKILDNFILREIRKKFPHHSILSEESGFLKGNSQYLWIVDSLDGSSNFANKNPFFSICIALMKDKRLVLSSIFAPAIGEFYFAQIKRGAFLNGKKIRVSKIKDLSQSYILYCDGHEKNKKRITKIFSHLFPKVKELRKIGSAGIETSWVASGRAEGFFVTKIDPWDVAAGVLLIKEARGRVTDFFGKKWQLKSGDFIFSNGKLHKKLQTLISF